MNPRILFSGKVGEKTGFMSKREKGGLMKAFECRRCGRCCYGEGGISLKKDETGRISRFLEISEGDFLERFCEKRNGKDYIRTGDDRYCVFYDREKLCMIHTVKPESCTMWPFYPALLEDEESWILTRDACPGINKKCSFMDFKKEAGK